ncbi:MAG: bifunctional riboflavin kinase/FAD synthetase [Bacillota bacterium]|nr:bifunctional riboflavin kinase/FAD synthetase [Bacillota bacterium]
MRVWRGEEARLARFADRPVLALGFFDGVHRGHQALVRRALADARQQGRAAGVLTFEPHPLTVVKPGRTVELLTTEEEKERLLAGLGLDEAVIYPFSRSLAGLPAEAFVREILVDQLAVAEVVVGYNFTFGAGGAGHYGLLRRQGEVLGFRAVMIPPVTVHRKVVSSTAIRERLMAGQVDEAWRMLGYPYFVSGRVGRGAGRGQKLGFPTANLELPPEKLIPRDGVYVAGSTLPGEQSERLSVAAVGRALTFAGDRRQVEVHLPGYTGDLYGAAVKVSFYRRLREMRRFPSREALQAQVSEDVRRAEALWPFVYSG